MGPEGIVYIALAIWFGGSIVCLLALEAWGVHKGFPITSAVRRIWKAQPWVFWWLGFSLGYLLGHFLAFE